MALRSVYFSLVGILATLVVSLVKAGPVTTPVSSVTEDFLSSSAPYEFPDDYSISLEQAVVTRKEFVSAALLNMVTELVTEIDEGKKARDEMMEAIEELRWRLKQQEEALHISQDSESSRWNKIQSRRSESKEKRPRSCHNLQQAGHSLSGFYLVRGSQRLEIVFCAFNSDRADDESLFLEETVDIVAN